MNVSYPPNTKEIQWNPLEEAQFFIAYTKLSDYQGNNHEHVLHILDTKYQYMQDAFTTYFSEHLNIEKREVKFRRSEKPGGIHLGIVMNVRYPPNIEEIQYFIKSHIHGPSTTRAANTLERICT